ncbi:MAG TPA: hypothetical protein VGD94_15685 [Vicinamibacterales bacterium]
MREVRALECQRLGQIDALLEEVERRSCELRADPRHHVRRSSVELRLAFASRGVVEPAVDRVRGSLNGNKAATARDYWRCLDCGEVWNQARRVIATAPVMVTRGSICPNRSPPGQNPDLGDCSPFIQDVVSNPVRR